LVVAMSAAKSQKIRRCLLGLIVLLVASVVWAQFREANHLETTTLDWRYRNDNRDDKISDRVVIIDIDEISMKNLSGTYGRWPWPRRIYKDLLEFLSLGEPKGFYSIFCSPKLNFIAMMICF